MEELLQLHYGHLFEPELLNEILEAGSLREVNEGDICEDKDKEGDNQCIGREIITASSKITGSSLQPPVKPLSPRGSRYPKINDECKKSDKDTNSAAAKAFLNAIKIDFEIFSLSNGTFLPFFLTIVSSRN